MNGPRPRPHAFGRRTSGIFDAVPPRTLFESRQAASLVEAMALHRSGQLEVAIAACRRAAAGSPGPAAMRLLALLLSENGQDAEALHEAHRAIARDEASAPSRAALGRILAKAGDWAGSAEAHGEAVRLDPSLAASHDGRGRALLALGRVPEACRSLDRAMRLRPPDPSLHRAYAAALLAGGDAGLERAATAAADFPHAGEIQHAHGLALFGRGLWTEAAQAFAEAAAKLPDDAAVQHDLGAALLEAGRGREAASAFRRALGIDPDRVASWHNLGSAEQAGGNMPAALTAYAQAYRRDPDCLPRLAQELAAGPNGRVYLRAADLRRDLKSQASR